MPIKYKAVQKPVPGKEEKKWYASANMSGEKTNKVQAQEIETLRKENEELKSRLEKLEKLLK